jgi:predicted enzyme related to lactoylglutathione lyase
LEAGAQLVLPKTSIGEQGFIALIKDSEGNLVGLHTPA